jgi:hypothetical protein
MALGREAVWCALVASLLLTPLALATGSWFIMSVAALLSTAVSFFGMFSLGPLTFLGTCLQLAAAFGLRRSATGVGEWKVPLLLGLIVWVIVVPVQILCLARFGNAVLGWDYAFPLVAVVGTIAMLLAGFTKPQLS